MKPLSFIADECIKREVVCIKREVVCIKREVVSALREQSYTVLYVADLAPAIPDTEVLEMATSTDALLLTSDKDFGELVFSAETASLRGSAHQVGRHRIFSEGSHGSCSHSGPPQ